MLTRDYILPVFLVEGDRRADRLRPNLRTRLHPCLNPSAAMRDREGGRHRTSPSYHPARRVWAHASRENRFFILQWRHLQSKKDEPLSTDAQWRLGQSI